PTASEASATYTVSVTDTETDLTGEADITIVVAFPVLTLLLSETTLPLTVGTASPTVTATATVGNGTYSYTVSPALPAGLLLDETTGAITGTPTASAESQLDTVTVEDTQTPTPASATATITIAVSSFDEQKVIDTFQEVTGAFISRRMDQIIANQPSAWTLDRRRSATGVPQVSMKASGDAGDPVIDLVMEYARVSDDQKWYVWSEAVFSRYTDSTGALNTRKGSFGMLSLGTDYLVTDTLAIGVMGQVDRASESILAFSNVKGTGWMVGPYLSMEISPDLFFNARGSVGRSTNTASIDVFEDGIFFDGRFKTSRALVQASFKGRYALGSVVIYPDAEVTYMRETQADYAVTDGVFTVAVPGIRAEVGRFSLGGTVDLPYATSANSLILFARPQLDWNFNRTGAARNLETWRSSLELGVRTDTNNGWDGELSLRYDGIGTSGFKAVAARAKFGMRF
ncbi:MAG: autotransporter domain-containing protein, partial [Roseinatronobacter sp.]|nr:autotransporter domain-containing protein [Roseinatronobacter sp.]